jgi:hypothetical protein
MTLEQSEIEEKAFRLFGIFLILVSIFSLFMALTGSNVIDNGTILFTESRSKTIGLKFDEGQIVHISYVINVGPDEINLIVETGAIMGGNIVDMDHVEGNSYKFEANRTQTYYISFINVGTNNISMDYEITIVGYNNNSICYSVFIITLIMGIVILFIFYKDKIFQL